MGKSESIPKVTNIKLPEFTIYSAKLLKRLNFETKLYKKCVGTEFKIEKLPSCLLPRRRAPKKLEHLQLSRETLECVRLFVHEIKNIPYADYTRFNVYLKPNFIIEKDDPSHNSGLVCFNLVDQKIRLYKDRIYKDIFHELLHKFVYRIYGEQIYAGFTQAIIINGELDDRMGDGIDEIYTALLTKRYFSKYDAHCGYREILSLGYFFEELIGREEMERLYFRSDLYGLVEKLSVYADMEKATEIIKKLDYLFYTAYPMKNSPLIDLILVQNTFLEIVEQLLSMFQNKLNIMRMNHYSDYKIQKTEKKIEELMNLSIGINYDFKVPILNRRISIEMENQLNRHQ